MICPIILCMLGSDNIDVAMFINIGLPIKFPRSKPPRGSPLAAGKKIKFVTACDSVYQPEVDLIMLKSWAKNQTNTTIYQDFIKLF